MAQRHPPPYFVLVYGGLSAFGNPLAGEAAAEPRDGAGAGGSWKEFWTLLHNAMDDLGDGFVAVGADELARLSREARL